MGVVLASSYVQEERDCDLQEQGNLVAKRSRVEGFAYTVIKRLFDLLVCFTLFPLAAALMIVLTITILLTSGSPILYSQERIGRHGKAFKLYKFRTMRLNSAQLLSEWLSEQPEALKEWRSCQKLRHDPRITRGGRFLRETSLDELPQIWNVIRGEMSLVGPRPIVKEELKNYGSKVSYYLAVVPGLTGLWQVSGRCNVSYEQRVGMDQQYVQGWTFVRDLIILLKTPLSVVRRDGAC